MSDVTAENVTAENVTAENDLSTDGMLNVGAVSEIVITSGAVTITQSHHSLGAETGTTDDLHTMHGGAAGNIIFVRAVVGDTITLKHGVSNIQANGSDVVIDSSNYTLLFYSGTKWHVLKQT